MSLGRPLIRGPTWVYGLAVIGFLFADDVKRFGDFGPRPSSRSAVALSSSTERTVFNRCECHPCAAERAGDPFLLDTEDFCGSWPSGHSLERSRIASTPSDGEQPSMRQPRPHRRAIRLEPWTTNSALVGENLSDGIVH